MGTIFTILALVAIFFALLHIGNGIYDVSAEIRLTREKNNHKPFDPYARH